MPLILEDSGGTFWSVGITNQGLLTTSKISSLVAQLPVLVDSSRNFWKLGITTSGILTTTSTSQNTSSAVGNIGLTSPNQTTFALYVLPSGILQTTPAVATPPPPLYVVKDSAGSIWGIGVGTDGTPFTLRLGSGTALSPILNVQALNDSSLWNIGVSTVGEITSTPTVGQVSQPIFVTDVLNHTWELGVLDNTGQIITERANLLVISTLPIPFICIAPRPLDVTESQFGPLPIFHTPTGNLVTVLADFSLYCCALQKFVLPEDTNVIEILEE